jgi:hypothetical protein
VIVVVVTIIVVVVGAVVVPEIQCYSFNIKLVIEIKQRKSIVTIKELHRNNYTSKSKAICFIVFILQI